MKLAIIRWIFALAAGYDGLVGCVTVFAPAWLFARFAVTPPNHYGYVQFPGALLIVFAAMFIAIAADPVAKRLLIPYGIALKVAYVGIVTYYWVRGGVPAMWKPFAIADTVMIVLFAWAYVALRRGKSA